jgi:hypothetical protein
MRQHTAVLLNRAINRAAHRNGYITKVNGQTYNRGGRSPAGPPLDVKSIKQGQQQVAVRKAHGSNDLGQAMAKLSLSRRGSSDGSEGQHGDETREIEAPTGCKVRNKHNLRLSIDKRGLGGGRPGC